MEVTKVTIQQLLRPTETCKYGQQLDIHSSNDRVLAIVQHEGTKEQVLFVFNVDSHGSLLINKLIPIKGSFIALLQSSTPSGCNVSINTTDGEMLIFRLPYDTITAKLFSHVKIALELYASSSSVNSPSSFDWLRGYESCRTGWDRFCKPCSHTVQETNYRDGLPDNWPWGYIITPNPEGSTEVAMCESLMAEFDPLHSPSQSPSKGSDNNVVRPRPINSQPHLIINPASGKQNSKNPFLKPESIRGSHSESNLSVLGLPVSSPLTKHSTKSQTTLASKRIGLVETSSNDFKFRLRVQGDGFESSGGSIENPFLEEPNQTQQQVLDNTKFWLDQGDFDIEMQKVNDEETDRGVAAGMGNRTGSLDVLNERELPPLSPGKILDYNFRRMRSITSSNTPSFMTQSFEVMSETPPIVKPSRSKTGTVQPSKAMSKSPKMFRKKLSPRGGASPTPKTSWVTRYQPGVLLLKGSMRECLIQRMLHEREEDFCEYTELRLFCGTWNVNGQLPIQRLDKWLLNNDKDVPVPHVYAIGFQELDLSTEALLTKESNREEMWIDLVESSLNMAGKFRQISIQRLVGILLMVYVQESLVQYITDVEADSVPCGIMGHLGNKGGVAIRFNIHHSSICIVNSHLAAHVEEVEKRNEDYHQIYSRLQFFKNTQLPYNITEHNIVVWMGDLNYRLQTPPTMTPDIIRALSDSFQLHKLLPLDQLHTQQKNGLAFTQFHEGKIDFKPTYKYDPSTNMWDTSEKNRAPAWCDRVLYYSQGDLLSIIKYTSYPEMIISDHKPVSCMYDAKVKLVLPDKERDVLEQITRKLDKQENETLPQVELNCFEFKFPAVKFMVKQVQPLKVHNIGQRPVQVSFIATPDKQDEISRPWLKVKPDRALILPGEEVTILLTLLVDTEIAPLLQTKAETLEDILVLHLEGGKDVFVSVVGEYLPSSFGSSLETLVHIHTNMREVPTAHLVDLTSSWDEYDKNGLQEWTTPPPLDIPKELFRLVQYLIDHGLKSKSLFTDGGLTYEQERIRDILDIGDSVMVGGVFSVAATLLLFLRALSNPVVPRSIHQKCMEGCNNATLCKQLLLRMPTVNRRTFVYLITFLKKLLHFTHENEMDAKLLASVFGEVLLNVSRETRLGFSKKSLLHMNKKKATFIYQFLVNDLTVDYN